MDGKQGKEVDRPKSARRVAGGESEGARDV